MIPEHIKKADDVFSKISYETDFLFFDPINHLDAKKTFLKQTLKQKKNPVFLYDDDSKFILDKKKELIDFSFKNTPLDIIYRKKQIDLIDRCNLYSNLGNEKFTSFSIRRWGRPSKKLVNEAYNIISEKDDIKYEKITSKHSLFLLKKELINYGLWKKWKIERVDRVSLAAVKYHDKVLSIKKKERFSKKYIQRFMVHEIGTHILRYENALMQPFKILRYGTSKYLSCEEGLAVYNEKMNGLLTKAVLRQYAGRIIAIDFSLKSSFIDVFNELRRFFKKDETAFKLALRAKRGISNTELAGGCTKDHVYLKGYFEIQKFIDGGGLIEELYVGKIGFDDVELIKKIPEIRPPKFIPRQVVQHSMNEY